MPGGGERRITRHQAVYRTLLRFYPRSFRREYGADMIQVFGDLAREGGRSLWIRTIRDVLASAPRVRWEEGMMRSTGAVIVGVLAGITAFTVIAVGGFTVPGMITAMIALVVVGGILAASAVFAHHNERPTEQVYRTSTRAWNWWTVLAALLALFFVVGGIVQNIVDPKIENVGGFAFYGGAAAAIFAGIRLRARGKAGGDWLIAIGALPGVLLFWVIGPAVAGLLVMVAAISENVRLRAGVARA